VCLIGRRTGVWCVVPDIVQFIEETRGVVQDVDAVEEAVEPGRRQTIWEAFQEHSTYGGRLRQRSTIWQRTSTRLVAKYQEYLTCTSTTTKGPNSQPKMSYAIKSVVARLGIERLKLFFFKVGLIVLYFFSLCLLALFFCVDYFYMFHDYVWRIYIYIYI